MSIEFPWHAIPAGQVPPQVGNVLPEHAGSVVVVGVAQPPEAQASRQLAKTPVQAPPPFGARHFSALLLSEHEVVPDLLVRQHVTNPGLPHVDLDAHLSTNRAQLLSTSVSVAWCAAQLT